MRALAVILGLLPLLASAQLQADSLRAALRRQLDRSQRELRAFDKTVEESGRRETLRFRPQAQGLLRSERSETRLAHELEPALKQAVFDPRLRGEFQIEQVGSLWRARRKPQAAPTDLLEQDIGYENRQLRRICSRYHFSSFLYDVYQTLEVDFDGQGRYLRHTLDERTVVALLGIDFRVRIVGAAVY